MKKLASLFLLFIFVSTAFAQNTPMGLDANLWQKALKLQKKAIVIDGHNDITSPMVDEDFSLLLDSRGKFTKGNSPFHSDLSRFKEGGLTAQFFSIYVSGTDYQKGGKMRRAMDMIDATYREIERSSGQMVYCTTPDEIRKAKKQGKICALMGIEGGYVIENSLFALRNFYRLGIRYMTLTHNVSHDWADAHRGEVKHNGLSDFGKEVVREMNRLGMLVDISHVSVKVMNDALDISTAPIIASHSSARSINDHTRNVPDDVLKRVAKNGGVIMINFYPSFLDARTNKEENERSARLKPQIDALKEQFKDNPQGYNEAQRKLFAENPIFNPDYKRIVDHIDHIKKVVGIDIVGIGSDFDGIPFLPEGMTGAESLPLITYEMLRRGYSETEIKKVLGENFLRAFAQAEKVAKNSSKNISGDGSLKTLGK
ncbi:MAG: dipeptidase [Pyrinomonadaceae bacterium]|jgi:membrane dipeptidase|nr:dipeptidase [Pyrinomonadaceae bacterium]